MFGRAKTNISSIVHLEIAFKLADLLSWVNCGYKGDLLDQIKLDHDKTWANDDVLKYKFDILPHPNGADSIFYHRHANSFSTGLDAFDDFSDAVIKKYPGLEKLIQGVGWNLHPLGFLCINILPIDQDRKSVIIVPTAEMFQLQLGNHFVSDDKEQIINVEISKEESEKVSRASLGMGLHTGIGYRNTLCRVKAYCSHRELDYTKI